MGKRLQLPCFVRCLCLQEKFLEELVSCYLGLNFQKSHFRPNLIKSVARNFKRDHPLLSIGQLTLV